jgi:hypothetical protein
MQDLFGAIETAAEGVKRQAASTQAPQRRAAGR